LELFKGGQVWKDDRLQRLDFRVENGRFVSFGTDLQPSGDTRVIDLEGKYVYPGMIDPHTHVGIFEEMTGWEAGNDTNEYSSPATPSVRAIDAINPLDAGLRSARNAGVTTVCVLPGSSNVIGGEGVVIKTAGKNVDKMVVPTPKKLVKMAFGRNPSWFWQGQKKSPFTRMAVGALLREQLVKAQNQAKKPEEERGNDLETRLLQELLDHKAMARIHVANMEDIETIARISSEFGFEYVLDHATALHTNPEFARSLGVPAILGPLNVCARSFQTYDLTFHSVQILQDQGLLLSLMTDAPVIPLSLIRVQPWILARLELSEAQIVDLLTRNAAKILGIEDRVGSLSAGLDADFMVLSSGFFDVLSVVENTYIQGKVVGGEWDEDAH